jgi:two-component system response regulator AtoC
MSTLNVIIVESAVEERSRLARLCAQSGWKPHVFPSADDFTATRGKRDSQLLILSLENVSGAGDPVLVSLRAWRESHRETQLLLLMSETLPAGDRLALALGARHVLHKPCLDEDITRILALIAQGIGKRTRTRALEAREKREEGFNEIIGVSARMLEVIELSRRVAVSETTSVMITGECGTGKGTLARAMHLASPRREGPFIEVNCAAIPRNLLESEFFGHEAGAFTDAKEEKMGLFECANGGTIFLDEVGEIDYSLQAKLLKFLDSRMIWRVGGTRFLPVDVRVISATNRDLRSAVDERRFREDLFYRLNVVEIRIPPLRERVADIRPIALTYSRRFASRMNKGEVALTEEAMGALERYSWPGNVRELINVIERAVLLNVSGTIKPAEFPFAKEERGRILPIRKRRGTIVIELPSDGARLEEIERAVIDAALAREQGNVTRAARLLGVGRGTLRYKMKKFGIESETPQKNSENGSIEPAKITD